jgi:hypothetical protein
MIEQIKRNKKLREEGKFVGIPMYEIFPKLEENLPSLPRGAMLLISAATGIGKSKFARFLLKAIYAIYTKHIALGTDPGFKPKFIVFLTEESKDEFELALTSMLIKDKYNYSLSRLALLSMKKIPLTDAELKMVDGVQPELSKLLSFIILEDSIWNPFGIYKRCRSISKEYGIHYYTDIESKSGKFITHMEYDSLEKKEQDKYKYAYYKQANPELYFLVLVDNLNNLSLEKGHNGNLLNSINDWSRRYAKQQLSVHWKWSVINVIQQNMETEKKQFTNAGNSITEKLKPSIAGLGNSKECARDHEGFIGLFKPAKYGIHKYEGYDTSHKGFHTNFISLIFEKNRLGDDTFELPTYFDGAVETFHELPDPEKANALIYKAKQGLPK